MGRKGGKEVGGDGVGTRIGGSTFFSFFFSRFNEAFLNLSSACRSIEGGGREDRVDPASTMDS